MNSTDTSWESRIARIRAILEAAAGGEDRAFGGLRPWQLGRDELLRASLEGVRLIAPEAAVAGSCCHSSAAPARSRSSRSGLVQGLRGEHPFDGTQYPRLPWGRDAVPGEDIEVIAGWIDDGCPADSHQADYPVIASATAEAMILPEDVPGLVEAGVVGDEYRTQKGELKQRMNIDCMSHGQRERLRAAFRALYTLNRWPEDARSYNNLALIHQNHCQHGWERFLTWHRVYLYEFEQALQDHDPDVTLPYWDFTMPAYKPEDPGNGRRIPRALQAYLTKDSLEFLARNGIPGENLADLVGRHFATQTELFAEVRRRISAVYTEGVHRERFIDALLDANALWYPLRYPGEFKGSTINQQFHYHYPSARDIEQILNLRTFRDFGGGSIYNESFGFLDQNPHNTMHLWTGGMNPDHVDDATLPADRNKSVRLAGRKFHKREDLYSQPAVGDMFSNLTASHDPVFWPIHVNIDRLWWEWQQRHPEGAPADLDAVLTPWSYTARDTLDIQRFGYEYVRSAYVLPVGLEAPVGRFVSRTIDVPATVRGGFQTAEVRLHRVPQLPRSCFIRVFLNLPDAVAQTPLDDPHYAGYLAVFGHGDCYGGPGHCEVPVRRKYDVRPRSHNTPRNHRIDVTERVKALFAAGAESLQISLVVVGADYREDSELLRLEGVSLNFLD